VVVLVECLCSNSVYVVAVLVYIVELVLVVCLFPSSVDVGGTFGLYFSAFGSLFVSILCTCCSHFRFIL